MVLSAWQLPHMQLWRSIKGKAILANANPPFAQLGFSDGAAQMQHFPKDDELNIFRMRKL